MKVRSTTAPDPALYGYRVNEKQDSEGFSDASDRDRQRKDHRPEIEVTEESVQGAIEEFGRDPQAHDRGILAALQGGGPGLKVVLTDRSGKVIRQLTGEEFLRLRESVLETDPGHATGKILDQKL